MATSTNIQDSSTEKSEDVSTEVVLSDVQREVDSRHKSHGYQKDCDKQTNPAGQESTTDNPEYLDELFVPENTTTEETSKAEPPLRIGEDTTSKDGAKALSKDSSANTLSLHMETDLLSEHLGKDTRTKVETDLLSEHLGKYTRKKVETDIFSEHLGKDTRTKVETDFLPEHIGKDTRTKVETDVLSEQLGKDTRTKVETDILSEHLGKDTRKKVETDILSEHLGKDTRTKVESDVLSEHLGKDTRAKVETDVLSEHPGKDTVIKVETDLLSEHPGKDTMIKAETDLLSEYPGKDTMTKVETDILSEHPGKDTRTKENVQLDACKVTREFTALRKMSNIHASKQIYFELASGAKMPAVGLGTRRSENGTETAVAVDIALDVGYRLIDTALLYDNEQEIGEVLKKKFESGQLKREEVFVTTKLPGVYLGSKERVRRGFARSITNLGLNYIDLYMIHSPCGLKLHDDETFFPQDKNGNPDWENLDIVRTWKAMEELVDEGRVKSLGLSNVNSEQIKRICAVARHPVSNVQMECNAYFAQSKLLEFLKDRNITFTAYAPLGSPGRPARFKAKGQGDRLHDRVIIEISKKHNRTPAQILLRNLIQRGICVIPKSVTSSRIEENIQVFDFSLTKEDMQRIEGLDSNVREFHFKHWNGILDHPEYPFGIPY